MSSLKTHCFVVIILLISSLYGQEKSEAVFSKADQAAINKVIDDAVKIANAPEKDWAAYTRVYYAPDAVVLAPNTEAIKGREAIASFLASFPPVQSVKYEMIEMAGAGDLAYVWGKYSMEMLPADSDAPVKDSGKYIEIWRKHKDGSWQITRDIFNSDGTP